MYVHFGQEIIAQVLGMRVESELVQEIYKKVYEVFVEEIVSFCFENNHAKTMF